MPRHHRPLRHWLFLATDDLPQCFLYRVEQKRQQLMKLGCSVRIVLREALEHRDWTESLLWADAVIVCRLPATSPVLRAIDAAHLAGLPTWYDLDDLVVDSENGVPPLETYGGTITPHPYAGIAAKPATIFKFAAGERNRETPDSPAIIRATGSTLAMFLIAASQSGRGWETIFPL